MTGVSKLRFCFFAHSAELGGAERSLLELVRELVADHQARCLVVLPGPGPLQARLEAAGAGTELVSYGWWCSPGTPDEGEARALRALHASRVLEAACGPLARFDPDLVCTQTLVVPWGALCAEVLGKPHVWNVREFGEADHQLRFLPPLPEVLALIEQSSDRVFTVTEAVRRELFPSLGDDRCLTLYTHIEPPSGPVAGEPRYFEVPGAFRLLALGTLSRGKGQRDVIEAVQSLLHAGVPVELSLVGSCVGEVRAELEGLLRAGDHQGRIRIFGFAEDPWPALAQADALVVCSRKEALGRVVLEGMSAGKPVIGTRAGGLPELIEEGVTGLLYQPGDAGELAARIRALVDDRALAARLGAAGRERVERTFTRERYGGRVFRAFTEVIDGWRASPGRAWQSRWRAQLRGAIADQAQAQALERRQLESEREALSTALADERERGEAERRKAQETLDASARELAAQREVAQALRHNLARAGDERARVLDERESLRRERDALAWEGHQLRSDREALLRGREELQRELRHMQELASERASSLQSLQAGTAGLAAELATLHAAAARDAARLESLSATLALRDEERRQLQAAAARLQEQLEGLLSSRSWRAVARAKAVRDRLLPPGTVRRLGADSAWAAMFELRRLLSD